MAVEIKLSEISLARRTLRFIDWKSLKKLNLVSKTTESRIPLFLGADVLAECNIAVANLPRTHAKFAKKGFAAKVYFPPTVRIVDVHGTGRGLWFYTIQGLFRIAFEYYSRIEQLECMIRLSKAWKDRVSDPLLKTDIHIAFDVSKLGTVDETRLVSSKLSASPSSEAPPSSKPSTAGSPVNKRQQRAGNTTQPLQSTTTVKQPSEENLASPPSGVQFVKAFLDQYKDKKNCGEIEWNFLAEVMVEIVKEYSSGGEGTPCGQGRQKVLFVISRWLGREFNKFQGEIEIKATEFKKKHITSIDNLPPAHQLIDELFPECMRILLLMWMGADTEEGNQASQARTCAKHFSLFPCVQLILEFANQILVSGVAHVLYSRLIKTDSV